MMLGEWRSEVKKAPEGRVTRTQAFARRRRLVQALAIDPARAWITGHSPRWQVRGEAGMCFVNSQNVRDLRQPFGGTKVSGTGREGGTWSYEVFCEPKNVCVSLGNHHIPHRGA